MIEGLWVVRFITPDDPSMPLNGGVAVIETGRILGGDSGYFYVGSIEAPNGGVWPTQVKITRHDPEIISVFGDHDILELSGSVSKTDDDAYGRPVLVVHLSTETKEDVVATMTKVADLP